MRKIIYLIILLTCITSVVAAEEKLIFDNWIFSEQSVYVNNQVFYFWITAGQTEITVRYDDVYLNVDRGECKIKDYIKICYNESEYDVKEREYKAKVKIYSLKPDIKITRTIDKSSFLIGEEATINVEIKNDGGKTAQNAYYRESFPSFIEITDVDGGEVIGSTVVWEGSIKKGETKELKYVIKSSKELEQQIKARFEYFDGLINRTIYSSALKLNIKHFLDINAVVSEDVIVGGEANLTLNLSNKYEKKIIINSLQLDIPNSLEILKYSRGIEKKGNSLLWEGSIDEGKSVELKFKFDTKRVGINTIFITANISYDDKTEVITKKVDLVVKNIDLFINTNLENNEALEAGYEKRLKIWVQNPNPYLNFTNIKIIVDTNLTYIAPVFIDLLNSTELKKIIDFVFIAPNITKTTNYPFKIKAIYNTQYGDIFTEELEVKNLKVEPITPLTITHSFSKSKVEEDEEIRLTVKVKNNRNVDLKMINVYDNSSVLLLKEGVSSALVDIKAKKTVTVYSYLITAPKVKNETKFAITTTADYEFDGIDYRDRKTSYLTVVPKRIKIKVSKSIDKEDKYYAGQILDVDYTITNTEDEAVKDIIIYFPKQKEFDVIGKEFYFFESLNPGEEVRLNDIEKIRIKTNGSLTLKESEVTYKDEDGNLFSTESNKISLKAESSYMQGPVIIINKSVPDKVEKGNNFDVNLIVENVGDSIAEVSLRDLNYRKKFKLAPNKKIKFSYKTKIHESSELKPAEARYNYLAMPFYAYSNSPTIKISEKEIKEVVEEPRVVEIVEKVEEKRKGFFARLWELFIKWFGG